MVKPEDFIKTLSANGVGPFVGVPCSILTPLIDYILDNPDEMEYLNPANESHALAIAAGYYLGSQRIPLVFMQNSGLGNIINPLTSLSQLYHVPALLLITWRGYGGPGSDAPEHDIVGHDLKDYLEVFHLPYEILSEDNYSEQIEKLKRTADREKIPVAAVVKSGFFDVYNRPTEETKNGLQMYDSIKIIKETLDEYVFLSTTGFISRESYAVRNSPDFYMLGSMGLVSAVGCGVALANKRKKFAVLDGDGAILMHLGLLPFIGSYQLTNFLHFIIDNRSYASTGNQPSVSRNVEFDKLALAVGYRQAYKTDSGRELRSLLESIKNSEGPILIWVKVYPGINRGVERVTLSPEEIGLKFIEAVK